MGTDKQEKKPGDALSEEASKAPDPEEAKRQAFRKLKPVGPIMKPLTPEEIDEFCNDPELKERDALLDAMPKGREIDDQDAF
jgi:hypothetical protein